MTTAHQSWKLRSIRLYLLASLLLHGLVFVTAITLAPPLIPPSPEPASNIVMTHLVSPPPQQTGKGIASPPPPLPADSRRVPMPPVTSAPPPLPSPAPAVPSNNNLHTAKRSEAPPETITAAGHSAKQGTRGSGTGQQETAFPPPVPRAGSTTGSSRTAPEETTFGSANGPAFRKQVQPVYPPLARRRGKEGIVVLRLSISETGNLTRLEVLDDPGHGFADAAQEAIRSSNFTPAHHNGKPIAVRAVLPIRFSLR